MVPMASGSLFHSVGAATVKQHIHMHLLGLVEETERGFPHERSSCLNKEDGYGGWLKFIAL